MHTLRKPHESTLQSSRAKSAKSIGFGALFFCVGSLYERYSVRSLKYFGGLAHFYPLYTRVFLLFSLANIAFPLTSSFVGEFYIFVGVFRQNF
jgi:NADH:ubiquinone oxidoreductase subunit 4 (subunit M)